MTTTLSSANAERLKLAFQQCRDMEGTLREQYILRGETSDSGVYGLLRREWEKAA